MQIALCCKVALVRVNRTRGGSVHEVDFYQIVLVIALLLYRHKEAILFIRATVDFSLLAKYKSHNKDIIKYLKAALYRIDKTKKAFLPYQPNDKNPPNFNIPKLYTISHYPEIIRVFSTLIETTTEHSKRAYIF